MIRLFPFAFILLWSSAFITTKPIVDNSEPFTALCFRFFFRIIASKKILDEHKPDQIYISSDRIYANGFFQPFLCAALQNEKQIHSDWFKTLLPTP